MKQTILLLAGLALTANITPSPGDWKMDIHQDGNVERICISSMDSLSFTEDLAPLMTIVPSGIFTMGDGAAYCGTNQLEVTLTRGFQLCRHEVTNQEFLEALQWAYDNGYVTVTSMSVQDNLDGSIEILLDFDNDYGEILFDGAGTFYLREAPSELAQSAYPEGYDPTFHPVKAVSWFGAARYCDWLSLQMGLSRAYEHSGDWSCNGGDPYAAEGYRLPTDAEWEYAAQWNDERAYPWGIVETNCGRANYGPSNPTDLCIGWTSPVGSYPDAPMAMNLEDMAGNVFEWCNDWWLCNLGSSPVIDPIGQPTGTYRVMRGGCWYSSASNLRSAGRFYSNPYASFHIVGFRIAKTINP